MFQPPQGATDATLRSSSLLCEPTPPKPFGLELRVERQLRLRRPEAATQGEAESLRSTRTFHVHMPARVQPDIAISKFVGIVKGNSSEWVSETCPEPSVAPCGDLIGFDDSVHGLTPVATYCRAARSDERPTTRLHLI